jgi:hypothetical protein
MSPHMQGPSFMLVVVDVLRPKADQKLSTRSPLPNDLTNSNVTPVMFRTFVVGVPLRSLNGASTSNPKNISQITQCPLR